MHVKPRAVARRCNRFSEMNLYVSEMNRQIRNESHRPVSGDVVFVDDIIILSVAESRRDENSHSGNPVAAR